MPEYLRGEIVAKGDAGYEVRVGTKTITAEIGTNDSFARGNAVVLVKESDGGAERYFIADAYRLNGVYGILVAFLLAAVVFGRRRGAGAILGLAVSIAVIALYIVPTIARGGNPFVTSIIGAAVILFVSLFLAHGFRRRTVAAFLGTLVSLGIAVGLSALFVALTKLTGAGTEEAVMAQTDALAGLNLKGLLLGGIIIGVLGVLDDVTATQAAAVDEISIADPKLPARELYRRGLSVGKEHIAALVNTLALAYAGAALPLFLLFVASKEVPWWVALNSEFVVEEIVRTLVGSTALLLAVPITTAIAAFMLKNKVKGGEQYG